MKTLIKILGVLLIYNTMYAQSPTMDFESWNSLQEPVGWVSFNFAPFCPLAVTKSTDSYSGNYAIQIQAKYCSIIGDTIPGFTLTGKYDTIGAGYTIHGGFSYSQRPQQLKGYYKYFPGNSSDTCFAFLQLTKWNSITNQRDTIGSGIFFSTDTTATYTLFTLDVTYLSLQNPDTAEIHFFSSVNANSLNAKLLVDELSFVVPPGGIISENFDASRFMIYPNPAVNEMKIAMNGMKEEAFLIIYDIMGRRIKNTELKDVVTSLDISDFTDGIYLYQVVSATGEIIGKGKFCVVK